MSNNGVLLDTTHPAMLAEDVARAIEDWNQGLLAGYRYPRAAWLSYLEKRLAIYYPMSSSADRKLTARHLAPFPLLRGSNTV